MRHSSFARDPLCSTKFGWVAGNRCGFGVSAFAAFEAAALEPLTRGFNGNRDHPRLATRAPRAMHRQEFRVGFVREHHNTGN
jgi:hypothetical protein